MRCTPLHVVAGPALLALAVISTFAAADPTLAARRVKAHTTFLADDLLEGRGTGTRGYAVAAHYVAAELERLGFLPGADHGSYEQTMPLLESIPNVEAGRLVVTREGKSDALTVINDMIAGCAIGQSAAELTAPAVFVGFGVEAPELNYNDFAGVNLEGKIAVVFFGAPERFPNDQRAHYAHSRQKQATLVRHGAVGIVTIFAPRDLAHFPWASVVGYAHFPTMRLLEPSGAIHEGFPQLRASATVNWNAVSRLFAASGHAPEEALAKSNRGEPQSLDLGVSLTLGGKATLRPVSSANVLGWLPGSDPALANEPVVVTGHLDHLGIGPAVNGDTIYNGAMDNAIGVAIMLAVAEDLANGPKLRRPLLFAALTGEEKGLRGAEYLATHPPARVKRYVANINFDMPLFTAPVRDVIAWGAEHSTLGRTLAESAARHHFTVSPDPNPEEMIFVRSDQYEFVRIGVPAIFLGTGRRSADPTVDLNAVWDSFHRERYHKPSDDLSQPIDWPSAGALTELMEDLTQSIANDPHAPTWLPGDFFGEQFAPKNN